MDADLRSALTAFLLRAREEEEAKFEDDEEFAEYLEHVLTCETGWAECFRVFYEMDGRYPTYVDLFPLPPSRLISRQ